MVRRLTSRREALLANLDQPACIIARALDRHGSPRLPWEHLNYIARNYCAAFFGRTTCVFTEDGLELKIRLAI